MCWQNRMSLLTSGGDVQAQMEKAGNTEYADHIYYLMNKNSFLKICFSFIKDSSMKSNDSAAYLNQI